MKINSKMIKLLLVFIIISCIPIRITQSTVLVNTLYSYSENDPIYDGVLEDTLWKTTRAIDITLYNIDDQTQTMVISIMSIYNEVNGSLSFGVIIPDATYDRDTFGIVFKTNATEELAVYNIEWGFGVGHNLKAIYCADNATGDGLSAWYELDGLYDEDAGGTEDTYGAGTYDGSKYIYEMHTFLDTGDTNGADYSLARNDKIEFLVLYLEADSSATYIQIRETDGDYDYCILNIGKQELLGPSTWFIVASLVASLAVIAYVSRKRK